MPETVDQEIHTLQSIFWSERDPDGLAFASLADAFRRKGEVREALDLLTDGMSRHPDFATGHVVATRLYVDQGMHSEAELAARRVLDLDPENLVALSALVSILSERGERGEAARHKTALFAADPDSEEARAVADIDLDAAGVDEMPEGGAVTEGADQELGGLELSDEWTADPTEAETPLELVADETGDEPPEITELAPETMYHESHTGSDEEELAQATDALGLEGAETEIEGLPGLDRELPDLDALESGEEAGMTDQAGELAADPLDLANLSVDHGEVSASADEEVVDLAALAPDEEADRADEEVVDLAALAPDEPDDEPVDLSSLAPDDTADEVADIGALAPDDEADGTDEDVVDLADLAPDEPGEEPVDLASLAPDDTADEVADIGALAPDDEADGTDEDVVDLAALAPDEPDEEEVVELASLAPEASVEEIAEEMELAAAREAAGQDEDEDSTEAVYTRTLADLYIKQGFEDKALEVLKRIQEREPDATDLAERIKALEEGEAPESGFGSKGGSSGAGPDPGAGRHGSEEPGAEDAPPPPRTASAADDATGRAEDDLERRARELAEPGDHDHEMDSPFAWHGGDDQPAEAGEDADIGSYLEGLLDWEHRSQS